MEGRYEEGMEERYGRKLRNGAMERWQEICRYGRKAWKQGRHGMKA